MSACKTIKCHLARLNKQIATNNKDFDSLSVEDKKVKIAWDVIQQLNASKFIPTPGTYMSSSMYGVSINSENYREMMEKTEKCNVCALGGIFASYVLNSENKIDISERIGYLDVSHLSIVDSLDAIFFKNELDLIEWCFESWENEEGFEIPEVNTWVRFTKHLSPTLKMRLIMENIVVHKQFRPDILPVCINNEWKTEKFPYPKVKSKP